MSDVVTTAAELKALRRRLGLTQAELADRLGVTRRHYGNLERGTWPLTRLHALALAGLVAELGAAPAAAGALDETGEA